MFVKKIWENRPSKKTPIDAEGLNDLEKRINDGILSVEATTDKITSGGGVSSATLKQALSKSGKVVSFTISGVITQAATGSKIVAYLPAGYRPSEGQPVHLIGTTNEGNTLRAFILQPNGQVGVYVDSSETGKGFSLSGVFVQL